MESAAALLVSGTGTTIAVSNLVGGIERWEYTADGWATTNAVASADNPLVTGSLVASAIFRAVVTNGVCAPVYSTEAMVRVDTAALGGEATAAVPASEGRAS